MRGLLDIARGAMQGTLANRDAARKQKELDRQIAREQRQDELEEVLTKLKLFSTPGIVAQPQLSPSDFTTDPAAPPPTPARGPAAAADMLARSPAAGDVAPQAPPRGRVSVGRVFGQDISFDPEAAAAPDPQDAAKEKRQAATRKAAYEELKRRDPKAYPIFVDGYEYENELASVLQDERTGRRQANDDARAGARQDANDAQERARRQRRAMAETRATNMLAAGAPVSQVLAALNTFPDIKGELTFDDVKRLHSDVGQTKDPAREERRKGIEKKVGTPKTELEQDLLEELADGRKKIEILNELRTNGASEEVMKQARRYMTAVQ
jgi:hypothetical protein